MPKLYLVQRFRSRLLVSLSWMFIVFVLVATVIAAAALVAVPVRAATAEAPAAVKAELDKMAADDGVPGVTLLVFRDGALLYRADAGDIAPDAQLPVASASKWMAAALVMTVVDEGKLSLDEPIGRRLPEFTGEAGSITLRQILSFTSGQGGLSGLVDLRQDPGISLRESARQIAALPLRDPPGSVFKYGSPAFQIAGALVEEATGKGWAQLFDERLARPLGLMHTDWGNPLSPDIPPSQLRNPNLQAGVTTSAEDYGKFLTMIAAKGLYRGHRILSPQSIALMESVQTRGVRIGSVPPGAQAGMQYGLGEWCEVVEGNGTCSVVSSPGALGTYPWIDRRNDLYGVFFMRRRLPLVEPQIQAARQDILRAVAGADSNVP